MNKTNTQLDRYYANENKTNKKNIAHTNYVMKLVENIIKKYCGKCLYGLSKYLVAIKTVNIIK